MVEPVSRRRPLRRGIVTRRTTRVDDRPSVHGKARLRHRTNQEKGRFAPPAPPVSGRRRSRACSTRGAVRSSTPRCWPGSSHGGNARSCGQAAAPVGLDPSSARPRRRPACRGNGCSGDPAGPIDSRSRLRHRRHGPPQDPQDFGATETGAPNIDASNSGCRAPGGSRPAPRPRLATARDERPFGVVSGRRRAPAVRESTAPRVHGARVGFAHGAIQFRKSKKKTHQSVRRRSPLKCIRYATRKRATGCVSYR
jgi:hypothetical protein